jgi:hypothetical protein
VYILTVHNFKITIIIIIIIIIIIHKILITPIIAYGAEAWTMSSESAKRLAVFERKVLRKILEVIKINNYRR